MTPSLRLRAETLASWVARSTAPWLLPVAVVLTGCGDGAEPASPHVPGTAGTGAGATGGQSGSAGQKSGSGGSGATQAEGGEAGADSGAQGGTAGTAAGAGDGPTTTALGFSVPAQGQVLSAQSLASQLVVYDPGSLLRCDVSADPK